MDTNLKDNLLLKHELRFNSNGKLKILMLSDIQETLDYDKRTLIGIEKIIETEKPDLVILGGDNCDGIVLKTEEELRKYLDQNLWKIEKSHGHMFLEIMIMM